eukprot:7513205-Alexandrium_andersonii.AAC.1
MPEIDHRRAVGKMHRPPGNPSLGRTKHLPQASTYPRTLEGGDPTEAGKVAAGYKGAYEEPNQSGRPHAGRLRGQS